ncbi:uncharacterized protein BXIN_1500 [Babesia sp. Xinjiang]|uniref:uncharacterized protein n=1 Tax=Babesia sp. Xinjiang TaxID=462227 RepID=UPI000A262634|nr:uncharacterized protein BXIN_1500 [Babesia sp. Xinjiang]ORM42235.1 hypothetical protein BXIN_1500 [Babesia sp. Xinjiang]
MSFLIHLCRFVGVISGFVVPVIVGLHAASLGNVKHANYYLRALVFWVILDRIFSPVLFALLGLISELLWPLAFSIISVVLVVPRSRVLEFADKYTVMVIKNGGVNIAAAKLCDLADLIKNKLKDAMCPMAKDETLKTE